MTREYDTLFFCASFFGYANAISAELTRRGCHVAWFEDRPGTDTYTKAMLRLFPQLISHRTEAYFEGIIENLRGHPIRTVFVIKGEALSTKTIQSLRRAFPKARFILYFWDSYRNMPAGSEDKVALFDTAFTFDPDNASTDPRLTYRPLFYLPDFAVATSAKPDIDVLFVGTLHSDRYKVLRRIEHAMPEGVVFVQMLYYPSRLFYYIRRVIRPSEWRAPSGQKLFKPLSRKEILGLIARSRAILDIERSVQSGYTIRTIETIAAQRKLLTTNPRLPEADFYRPANHLYIDRYRPEITKAFLQAPYETIGEDVTRRYTIDGWIDEIFGTSRQAAGASLRRTGALQTG